MLESYYFLCTFYFIHPDFSWKYTSNIQQIFGSMSPLPDTSKYDMECLKWGSEIHTNTWRIEPCHLNEISRGCSHHSYDWGVKKLISISSPTMQILYTKCVWKKCDWPFWPLLYNWHVGRYGRYTSVVRSSCGVKSYTE